MKILTQVLKIVTIALLGWTSLASGQTFSSGSTGADGAFAPAANTVVTLPADGVLNYTTVTIPAGVTVTFQRNAANTPVTMLATGDVTINGTISVNGANGLIGVSAGSTPRPGALGGPGGFNGGNGGVLGGVLHSGGQGPGGGVLSNNSGTYGAPTSFVSLVPLFGGSGASGTPGHDTQGGNFSGTSGSGGGGAIVIASSSKIVFASTSAVTANGGNGVAGSGFLGTPGAGSGGAIRLVAPQISGPGSLQANGGTSGGSPSGGNGRIRVEAFSIGVSGSISPVASQSFAPGPVNAASNPALVALPTLTVTSVGGAAAPAVPGGSYTAADVTVPQGTANPVPVVVTATNTPTSATVRVKLMPPSGNPTTSAALTPAGTFQSSTVTANMTFPVGSVSLVQAWATMTLTGQIAMLFPLIDGEPVESVAMASPLGDGKPVLSLVTRSGREKRFDELTQTDQLRVAQAWQLMRSMQ